MGFLLLGRGVGLLLASGATAGGVLLEVGVDGVLEVFDAASVGQGHDVSVVNEDVQVVLLGDRVELVLQVLSVLDISLEAEDSPLAEVNGLVDDLSEDVRVTQVMELLGGVQGQDAGSLKYVSLKFIGINVERQIPFFDFLRV